MTRSNDEDALDGSAPATDAAGQGAGVIEAALRNLPDSPGVYRMLDPAGKALYVGKARSLRKRVAAYTRPARLPERLRRMVNATASLEIITTHTEAEALLLESNLIKRLEPRFNIVLRDDKSYPWLVLTGGHAFPRIAKHRGAHKPDAQYFGPYASAWAVNQAMTALQRAFLLRSCTDAMFASRSRPCLLYQIKRCAAPCVGRVSEPEYAGLVTQAKRFLSGHSAAVQKELAAEMEAAAADLAFEHAARLRDRIRGLTHVQGTDAVNATEVGDADIIAIHQSGGVSAIQVFFIRAGRNNGNRAFFPTHVSGETAGAVLGAFIGQFYDDKPPPRQLLLSHDIPGERLVADALTLKAGASVSIAVPKRGPKRGMVALAETNAREALERRRAERAGQAALLDGVATVFGLPGVPQRIEVYDNSHTRGREPYGVMIVAGPSGFLKAAYRKFIIKGEVTPGDDIAMMREVLSRRFGRLLKESEEEDAGRDGQRSESWPDLVLIDGGATQLAAATETLAELGVEDVPVAAIAKGPDRNAGRERFFLPGREPFDLPARDPVLYYLQRLRDEAHRFAIAAHRAARQKTLSRSGLDGVEGIGPARKRALLNHFGSARGVAQAGLAALEACPGIERALAARIYEHFHPGSGPVRLTRTTEA
ncbi:excinuclease ABC subunit UvrC [Elioraea rosea]|uniref:excinuclease ABC subunit UvrC n=1 Tax=Elioraea rosea TaxID=2492390 RepID=UPI0011853F56|nr:excinuclease ABC subunit UvrC [Elioraea rosea]